MALWSPGVPPYVRPAARARGLPVGVARCGCFSLLLAGGCAWVSSVLTGIRVTGGAVDRLRRLWRAGSGAALRSCTTHGLGTGMLTPFHHAGCFGTRQPVGGLRGYGAAGSASAWHAEGQGFESP